MPSIYPPHQQILSPITFTTYKQNADIINEITHDKPNINSNLSGNKTIIKTQQINLILCFRSSVSINLFTNNNRIVAININTLSTTTIYAKKIIKRDCFNLRKTISFYQFIVAFY